MSASSSPSRLYRPLCSPLKQFVNIVSQTRPSISRVQCTDGRCPGQGAGSGVLIQMSKEGKKSWYICTTCNRSFASYDPGDRQFESWLSKKPLPRVLDEATTNMATPFTPGSSSLAPQHSSVASSSASGEVNGPPYTQRLPGQSSSSPAGSRSSSSRATQGTGCNSNDDKDDEDDDDDDDFVGPERTGNCIGAPHMRTRELLVEGIEGSVTPFIIRTGQVLVYQDLPAIVRHLLELSTFVPDGQLQFELRDPSDGTWRIIGPLTLVTIGRNDTQLRGRIGNGVPTPSPPPITPTKNPRKRGGSSSGGSGGRSIKKRKTTK